MKSIRLVSLGLAALLAAGALGGCKGSGDSDVKSPYDFEKYDPVVELTTDRYITSEDGLSAWEDDPYIRWAEVNLGIRWKPKFVVASKQEHDQKLVLLAATDDLPDVICDAPAYLVKQWQQGGFLRVLQDDIEQWGSDLTKYLILDEYQKQSNGAGFAGYTTADGKFYALPMVLDPQAGAWPKLFYRSDILDELGMKEPTTLVELEEVFAAFKEKYPDQAAYVLDDYFFGLASSVFQLHGCNLNTYYEKDGQIVFGSIQPEAKDALATLRDWYKKGYIAKDFSTMKYETEQTRFSEGNYFMVSAEQWFPKWMSPKLNAKKSNARLTPLPQLKDRNGKVNAYYSQFYIHYPAVVSKTCKNPEAVIKEMNVLYESGMRNEKDLREKGFSFRWPETQPKRPINLDEVKAKGINAAKYDYTPEEQGPHFLNGGPTNPVGILYGNGNSRAVSTANTQAAAVLKLLQEKDYDMDATLDALPEEQKSWFDLTFISNPEAMGNPWGCEATLKNTIQLGEMLKSGLAVTDGGWTQAYTGQAYDDYSVQLEDLEREYFVQIVTGERPLDDFDKFVTAWRENGGDDILNEKNEAFHKK